jgi:hypothetical protein
MTPMGSSPAPDWADGSTARLDRQDPYLRIHSVSIFVRDQDRSLRFYLDRLGFGLVFDAHLPCGDRWVAVAPPDTFALVGFDEMSREVEAQRRALAEKLESERRAAQELEIAKQVQARLFPQTLPHSSEHWNARVFASRLARWAAITCAGIVGCLRRPCLPRLSMKSGSSVLMNSMTTSL